MSIKTLTTAEKRSQQAWLEHVKMVQSYTKETMVLSESDAVKLRKRLQEDYEYFVGYIFPHYAKSSCAPYHLAFASKVKKHANLRAQYRVFRGGAKSVHADIFLPMWLNIQPVKGYNTMVLVGANNDAADNLLGDLQAEYQYNARFIQLFGERYQLGSWEEGNFTTSDGCAHFALGIGQKPRGLRKGAFRPDLIVIDDVDDDEMVQNEPRVDKLVNWIIRSLIPTMDKGQGRVIQANNLIHEKSVTAKLAEKWMESEKKVKELQKSTGKKIESAKLEYYILDVPIRDAQGKPSWPSKYTEEDIQQIEIDAGYAAFESEYMNNPITEGKVFLKKWMQYDKLPPVSSLQYLVAYLDGGFKNRMTSDSKALVLIGLKDGKYYLYKAYCGRASRVEMVDWHYDLYRWLQNHNASALWYMEEVFLLDLLYEDFAAGAKKHGFPIPLSGDTRKKPDKDLRITSLQGIFQRGNVTFNKAEEQSHHMKNLEAQFLAFEPPKKTLKDGPDAFEGAVHLLNGMVVSTQPPVVGRMEDVKSRAWRL
jgi:phage terminase large subunit-like protein